MRRFFQFIPALFTLKARHFVLNAEDHNLAENDILTSLPKQKYAIETAELSQLKIFSGTGNGELAHEVAAHLEVTLGRIFSSQFADGETNIKILDDFKDQNIFVIQSIEPPNIDDKLMELFFIISTLKRNSAKRVIAIIPYLAYARLTDSDRLAVNQAGAVAQMLATLGCDMVITFNSMSKEIKGFYPRQCPMLHVDVTDLAVPIFMRKKLKDPIVICPSQVPQQMKRTNRFVEMLKANGLKSSLGMIQKVNEEVQYLGEEINGRDVILFDNIISSGRTIDQASTLLKQQGAQKIYAFAVHGLFINDAIKRIQESSIDEVIVTNSVSLKTTVSKIHQISISKLLAEVINVIRFDDKKTYEQSRPRHKIG